MKSIFFPIVQKEDGKRCFWKSNDRKKYFYFVANCNYNYFNKKVVNCNYNNFIQNVNNYNYDYSF